MNFPDIQQAVGEALRGSIKIDRTPGMIASVENVLNTWLNATPKKQVPNLEQLVDDFRKRISVLARSAELDYANGQIVVKATGDAETTLRMLRRGSDWFDPADDVDKLIAGAMLSE